MKMDDFSHQICYLIKSEQRTDELKLKVHEASDANVNSSIFIV